MVQFADDTDILVSGKNMVEQRDKIDAGVKQHEVWFFNSDLTIYTEKTKVMLFHCNKLRSADRPRIVFNKTELNYTSHLKFLGIYITDNLNWSTHIQALSSNLIRALYIIKTLRGILSTSVLRNIYFTKLQSILRYGTIFWGGESEPREVFKLQKKVLHTMKGVKKVGHIEQHLGTVRYLP
jgi:hypothetical protein